MKQQVGSGVLLVINFSGYGYDGRKKTESDIYIT